MVNLAGMVAAILADQMTKLTKSGKASDPIVCYPGSPFTPFLPFRVVGLVDMVAGTVGVILAQSGARWGVVVVRVAKKKRGDGNAV